MTLKAIKIKYTQAFCQCFKVQPTKITARKHVFKRWTAILVRDLGKEISAWNLF
jgi:hypothetical protein